MRGGIFQVRVSFADKTGPDCFLVFVIPNDIGARAHGSAGGHLYRKDGHIRWNLALLSDGQS